MDKKALYVSGAIILIMLIGVGAGAYKYKIEQDATPQETEEQADMKNDDSTTDNTETDNASTADSEQSGSTTYFSEKGAKITVTSPSRGSKLTSPVSIEGSVPGNWSSEGGYTIRLIDPSGNVLVNNSVSVSGNWMTEDSAKFSSKLSFSTTTKGEGSLELVRANPSGLAENDDKVVIPVEF